MRIFPVRIALSIAVIAGLLIPATASADSWVTGCVGYYAEASQTCVVAKTGGKDYATKRQWVGPVRAEVRGLCLDGGTKMLETWGDGFYFAKSFTTRCRPTAEWIVNRWVRSGTNVCAASTSKYGTRRIACIAIRV